MSGATFCRSPAPQEHVRKKKRGTEHHIIEWRLSEIPCKDEVAYSPRYKRKPLHCLLYNSNGSFRHFHSQDEHNASLFQ